MRHTDSPTVREFENANYRVEEATRRINNIDQRLSRLEGSVQEAKEHNATKEDVERAKNWIYGAIASAIFSGLVLAVSISVLVVRLVAN